MWLLFFKLPLFFTRKCHPQLASQRLRYPHGNKSLDLVRAKHVDAAAEL